MTVAQQTIEKKAPRRRLAPSREGFSARPEKRGTSTPRIPFDKDDWIRLAAERLLRSSDYYSVRVVRCFVVDGVVMLFGTVPSYYMKQIAQTVVMKMEMAIRIENHCEVKDPSHRNGSNYQST